MAAWVPPAPPLRVFQDFFVDLDLPQSLTVGDEVSIPVGVFNYLAQKPDGQAGPWPSRAGSSCWTSRSRGSNCRQRGQRGLFPHPGQMLRRPALPGDRHRQPDVRRHPEGRPGFPNGKQIAFSQADRLEPGKPVIQKVTIPAGRDRRHPEAAGEDLPRHAQPGGGGPGQHAAHALRLLRADLVDDLSQRAGAGLPQAHQPGAPKCR